VGGVAAGFVVAAYALLAGTGASSPSWPLGAGTAPAPGPVAAGATDAGGGSAAHDSPGPDRAVRPAVEHDLATVLVSRLGGFEPADPARFRQGPLDANAAAHLEPNPSAERARLTARGFQRGYQRAWTAASGEVVGAVVYQFGDDAGAHGYLDDGATVVLGQGGEELDVPLQPARGFVHSDGASTVTTVAFARGPYFFLVFATGEAEQAAEQAVAVSYLQLGRLAGLW
jgi:hypothetical protein